MNQEPGTLEEKNLERHLSFSLGDEEYAVPLLSVKEVIAIPEITPVPHTPPYFLGIMNLRGQVISVMDLRLKLGIKANPGAETTIIICDLKPYSIGLVVDSVNSVLNPVAERLNAKPEIQSNRPTDYITGVYQNGEELVLFLNIAKTLNLDDQKAVQSAAKKAA